jgi:hypothetical protein
LLYRPNDQAQPADTISACRSSSPAKHSAPRTVVAGVVVYLLEGDRPACDEVFQGLPGRALSTAEPRHSRKVRSDNVQDNVGFADRRHDGGFRVAIVTLLADIAAHKD